MLAYKSITLGKYVLSFKILIFSLVLLCRYILNPSPTIRPYLLWLQELVSIRWLSSLRPCSVLMILPDYWPIFRTGRIIFCNTSEAAKNRKIIEKLMKRSIFPKTINFRLNTFSRNGLFSIKFLLPRQSALLRDQNPTSYCLVSFIKSKLSLDNGMYIYL